MKQLLIALPCLMLFSSSVDAAIQCPPTSLIEDNIDKFITNKKDTENFNDKKVTLGGKTWEVVGDVVTTDIQVGETKSLNPQMSDIDEHTCNYLLYPMDSNVEDMSLMLQETSK
jgi:hypothetical protein